MTNAKIDAFFGPLDLNLNAANSTRLTGNFELAGGKDNPKDTEGPGSAAFFSRRSFNDRTTIFYNVHGPE